MKKNNRLPNEVNAGSMADIAFLLLIFFLVTTTIDTDKGISVRLPPISLEPPSPLPEKNVLTIKVNANNRLLVEGEERQVDQLREETKMFITNPKRLKTLPTSPRNAIISLQHDRGTSYEKYVEVYNELQGAYNELWEQKAQEIYSNHFRKLSKEQISNIKKIIPLVISEAEPMDYASK